MTSPTPPDFFAESANKSTEHHADSAYCSDAQVGLPSEEEIARAIYHSKPRNKPWDVLTHEFKNQYRKQARAILDLIRPAFEREIAKRDDEMLRQFLGSAASDVVDALHAELTATRAKLAQAVEAGFLEAISLLERQVDLLERGQVPAGNKHTAAGLLQPVIRDLQATAILRSAAAMGEKR